MQTPQGYTIAETPAPARAVMTDFWEVVFTPSFLPRIMHVWVAAWTAGSALMLSVSAWYLLRKKHLDLARSNLKLALPFFVLFTTWNLFLAGPNMAISVTDNQPLKLASMEGLWESTSCAPMFLLGWVDVSAQTTTGFSIPCLLSFLAYQDIDAVVAGLDSFAPDPTPPINLVFQVYHVMINLAPLLAGIAVLAAVWYLWKRRLYRSRFVLGLLVVSVVLAEIAITAGWWTAEIGRQPWVVYDVLKTADGVSPPLSGVDVAISLGGFIGLYSILFVLFLYLMNKKIQAGPEPLEEVETVAVTDLPDTLRDIFRKRPHGAGPPPVEGPTEPADAADETLDDADEQAGGGS
jgi:cytochrome d ubiquinol oxidase subunit I